MRRIFCCGLLLLVMVCSAGAQRKVWRQDSPLAIKGVVVDERQVKIFERVTLDVDLQAAFDNPFDADDVRIDAEVIEQSGETWSVPGFFHVPYKRNDSAQVPRRTEIAGGAGWRVRL